MLGLENVIDLVKSDFYSKKSSDPCYDFFYSSALAHLISLEIASSTYANQCMSYEDLCKKMPSKLGCRSTIYSTLNTAVIKGFFTNGPEPFVWGKYEKMIFREKTKSI